jgi:hypothetical protein
MELDYRSLPGHVRFSAGSAMQHLAEEIAELGLTRIMTTLSAASRSCTGSSVPSRT